MIYKDCMIVIMKEEELQQQRQEEDGDFLEEDNMHSKWMKSEALSICGWCLGVIRQIDKTRFAGGNPAIHYLPL